MSLSGDKGVAQFKKSVKMEHPSVYQETNQTTNHGISPQSKPFVISMVLGYLMNIKEVCKRFFLHSWEFSTSFCSSLYLYLMKAIAELNNRVRKMYVMYLEYLVISLFFPTCSPVFWNCAPWFWSSWSWIKKYSECSCDYWKTKQK